MTHVQCTFMLLVLCGSTVDSLTAVTQRPKLMLYHLEIRFHSPQVRGQSHGETSTGLKGLCPDVIFTSAHILLAKESYMATANLITAGKVKFYCEPTRRKFEIFVFTLKSTASFFFFFFGKN